MAVWANLNILVVLSDPRGRREVYLAPLAWPVTKGICKNWKQVNVDWLCWIHLNLCLGLYLWLFLYYRVSTVIPMCVDVCVVFLIVLPDTSTVCLKCVFELFPALLIGNYGWTSIFAFLGFDGVLSLRVCELPSPGTVNYLYLFNWCILPVFGV